MAKRQDLVDLVALTDKLAKNLEAAGKYANSIHTGIAGANQAAGTATGGNMSNPGGGTNGVVSYPKFGGSALGTIGQIIGSVAGAGISAATNMLPSPAAAASYQLSTSRQGFFSGMSFGQTGNLQRTISAGGTALNSQDAVQAISALQGSGVYNINQVGRGVASLSNYAPGLGLAGTAQAAASLDQGMSVNRLKQIGINVRGSNGLMNDPQSIANDFVEKIWQETPPLQGSSSEAMAYLMGSLQPGNQLYYILQSYIQDDGLKQIIIAKLFAKAKGLPANATKSQLTKAGLLTAVTNAQSAYNTSLLGVTQASQADINAGTAAALKTLTGAANEFAKVAKHLGPELKAYGFGSTLMGGIGTGASSALGTAAGIGLGAIGGKLLHGVGNMFSKAFKFLKESPGKLITAAEEGNILDLSAIAAEDLAAGVMLAKGGPADKNLPYIVGEKGPELFIPENNGTVIPNDITKKLMRANGGPVTQGGFASMLLGALGAPVTAQNISDLTMWENMEGGNWHNTAKYNPLNTSYQFADSVNFNTGKSGSGVQAYNSWQQGLQATVGTLTGANASSRGYTNIVNALRSGNMSQADFLKALQSSSWDAGRYKGGMASSSSSDSNLGVSGLYSGSGYSWLNKSQTGSTGAPVVNIAVNVPAGTDPHAASKTAQIVQEAVTKALKQAGVTKK